MPEKVSQAGANGFGNNKESNSAREILFSRSLILTLLVFSCATSRVDFNPGAELSNLREQRLHFFVGGLLPASYDLNSSELCPSGLRLARAETKFSGMDGLLTFSCQSRLWGLER